MARRGWVIHRLRPPHSKESNAPGKALVDVEWTKKSKPPSEHQLQEWFTSENDYNVGLLCGLASGVIVIDVDDILFMGGVDVGIEPPRSAVVVDGDRRWLFDLGWDHLTQFAWYRIAGM